MGKYNLYLESGYLDFESVIHTANTPFTYIIGARGVGKTYGAFRYVLKHHIPFIFMRRQQVDIDKVVNKNMNPAQPVLNELGMEIAVMPVAKNIYGFFEGHYSSAGKFVANDEPLGISVALSTIKNLRGFDCSRFQLLFYDEFIPEIHATPIREEFFAYCNAIETIARNRELDGAEPLKVVCCSNSNDLCNPYFIGMGLVHNIANMAETGQNVTKFPDRATTIINLNKSPISERKRKTALYRMAGDNAFTGMALDNSYNLDYSRCKIVSFKDYQIIAQMGEVYIYKHKSTGCYHISPVCSGTPSLCYNTSPHNKQRFRTEFVELYALIKTSDTVSFDSPIEEQYLVNIFEEEV